MVVAHGLAGLAVLVLAAVAAGLAHATGALAHLGPVSAMQVHVGAALAAVPLLAWHAAARGGARPRRSDLSRRALLRAGVVAGGAALLWLADERAARLVAPGRRGFWWVKWVVSVELDPTPWWRQPPFPLT